MFLVDEYFSSPTDLMSIWNVNTSSHHQIARLHYRLQLLPAAIGSTDQELGSVLFPTPHGSLTGAAQRSGARRFGSTLGTNLRRDCRRGTISVRRPEKRGGRDGGVTWDDGFSSLRRLMTHRAPRNILKHII